MSVRLSWTNFKLILLFCFSMGSSHFWTLVLHDSSSKRCFSIFDLGPLHPKFTPQNLPPPKFKLLLFVSRLNRTFFWPSFLHEPLYKTSSIFDLCPLTLKIYSPKFAKKSPICQLVWQIDRRCLGLPGGFRGWPIKWNHAKMLWGRPLLP